LVSLKCCSGTARLIRILLHFGDISKSGGETWEVRRQIEDNTGQNIFKKDTYWADFEPCIQNSLSSCQILRTCHFFPSRIFSAYVLCRGSGSVVGIATGYGLDGPGIESRWGRDFPHLSRPALGPTQPPVQ